MIDESMDEVLTATPEGLVEDLIMVGDFQGAQVALEYFINQNMHYPCIYGQLGSVHYLLGQYDKALSYFKRESGNQIANSLNMACCFFEMGDFEHCKEMLSKVKGSHMDAETLELRNRLLACLRKPADLSDFLASSIDDQICLARVLFDADDVKKAVTVLSRLIPQTDGRVQESILCFISRCFYELGNFKEAHLYSEKSHRLIDSRILNACCLYETGERDLADLAMFSLRHLEDHYVESNRCVFTGGCFGDQVWSRHDSLVSRYNYCVYLLSEMRYKDILSLLSVTRCQEEVFLKANAMIGLAGESDLELVRMELLREARSLLEAVCETPFASISEGIVNFIEGDFAGALRCWENEPKVGDWNMALCLVEVSQWSNALAKLMKIPDSYTRSSVLVRCYAQLSLVDNLKSECLLFPRLWITAGREFVRSGDSMRGFDCFMRSLAYADSTGEKHECFDGLNQCAKGLFDSVVETGKKHAELDQLVMQLKEISENTDGLIIVQEIENWINEYSSYVTFHEFITITTNFIVSS